MTETSTISQIEELLGDIMNGERPINQLHKLIVQYGQEQFERGLNRVVEISGKINQEIIENLKNK